MYLYLHDPATNDTGGWRLAPRSARHAAVRSACVRVVSGSELGRSWSELGVNSVGARSELGRSWSELGRSW
eukprot:scaffold21718_cov146-Isochrysis_galbana.AAC.1